MNDWVNCLRLVAFGQNSSCSASQQNSSQLQLLAGAQNNNKRTVGAAATASAEPVAPSSQPKVDVLLEKRGCPVGQAAVISRTADYVKSLDQQKAVAVAMSALVSQTGPPPAAADAHPALLGPAAPADRPKQSCLLTTASQAAAAAASALAKTRQRQPSLLGSCKPQPPTDSPFIQATAASRAPSGALVATIGQIDTLTPTVRGQLISAATSKRALPNQGSKSQQVGALDEEEENMLYCSIEDNPSEHNYRVKVIETELSLRCQLKCYQLTAPTTINQQYEQLGQFQTKCENSTFSGTMLPQLVTFYQLIVGPQELTLLNDYAASSLKQQQQQQQGLWSWPYQCIRRYGFDKDNCFMFEAGRKCTSGPGQFIVQTPKAYNIYQDVVKFVNELRSLNTNETSGLLAAQNVKEQTGEGFNQPAKQHQVAPAPKSSTVTQIPVTWTPSAPTNVTINVDTTDTRQQFFDTLRQMETNNSSPKSHLQDKDDNNEESDGRGGTKFSSNTSHSKGDSLSPASSPASTASDTTQVLNGSSNSSIQTKSNGNNKSAAITPEETDESGYEQGDDSVDSLAPSRMRLINGGAARKRQANDSMSSSSSTSSGGSPGHSVSRRSTGGSVGGATFNSQGPSKRSPLKTAPTAAAKSESKLAGVRNLITDKVQLDDFEASLIRDVYSEITKLHAKFAVTSGSADDGSISDNSSSNEGSDSTSMVEHEECALGEPMYTNLRGPGGRRSGQEEDDDDCQPDPNRKSSHNLRLQSQTILRERPPCADLYANNNPDYLSPSRSGPMFPTTLNPIPECGELAPQSPKTKLHGYHEIGQTKEFGSSGRRFDNVRSSENASAKSKNTGLKQAMQKSRLPTNHYVINDVQYAKISRNMRSKHD